MVEISLPGMNKQLFIAGNWKSNKTKKDAEVWIDTFKKVLPKPPENLTIVLCVPFTLLDFFHSQHLALLLAAQDVSPFGTGAYTGEIAPTQIKEFADWVVIGHSERRKYFLEDDRILSEKVIRAKDNGLSVMYCVQDDATFIPPLVDVVAYEPLWAIGTGKSDTPENANVVCSLIKQKFSGTVIYGGSVTEVNVRSFVEQSAVDGVLPGGASLDPQKFAALIRAVV
jgi:triosephosphate isomerase (TIM)